MRHRDDPHNRSVGHHSILARLVLRGSGLMILRALLIVSAGHGFPQPARAVQMQGNDRVTLWVGMP